MKTWIPAASLAVLLTACGGSDTASTTPQTKTMALTLQGAQHAPSEYTRLLQSIYIGFFGRPADARGLQFWSNIFSERNLPLTAPELIAAYANNVELRSTLDAFAASQEFGDLYVNNHASFINALYLNAFNRNAEAAGIEFWASLLDSKQLMPAQVVLSIVGGAQNDDAVIVAKKIEAATLFTSLLDTSGKILAYDGARVNSAVRVLLSTITAGTDMAAFRAEIDAFIATMEDIPGPFPAVSYYAGYHYLQDVTGNAPLYAANYTYGVGGVAQPATTGKLSFGQQSQTIGFSRVGTDFVYDAPVIASAGIGGGTLPAVSMLCQSVATPEGNTTKSTDVLVARSATQLVDAAALANQTFTVYRENCVKGGSNLKSISFDAQGNGTFPSGSGVLTLNPVVVTRLLNGQVLPDLSTGKFLVFSAYRYQRADQSTGYVIVQHLGNQKTGVTEGVLAIWSQE